MRQKTQTLNHHHFLTITIILQDSTFEQNYEDEDGFSNVFPLWRDFNPTHPRKWTFFVTLFKKELISDIAYVTLCTIFMCHSYYKIKRHLLFPNCSCTGRAYNLSKYCFRFELNNLHYAAVDLHCIHSHVVEEDVGIALLHAAYWPHRARSASIHEQYWLLLSSLCSLWPPEKSISTLITAITLTRTTQNCPTLQALHIRVMYISKVLNNEKTNKIVWRMKTMQRNGDWLK